jgi:CHASE3 domain sensor protein
MAQNVDIQTAFNIVLGIAGTVLGWLVRGLWALIAELQKENKEITKKISEIEVLVAGDYVKRESFERTIDALFKKLDAVYEIVNKKADR